jgi:hypothetical protein
MRDPPVALCGALLLEREMHALGVVRSLRAPQPHHRQADGYVHLSPTFPGKIPLAEFDVNYASHRFTDLFIAEGNTVSGISRAEIVLYTMQLSER